MRKLVIIGFGRRGKTILGALRSRRDVAVIAVCDPNPDVCGPAEIDLYRDTEEALNTLRPDVAIIATPPRTHASIINICNRFNVTVICEKPLVSHADELSEIATVSIRVYTAYQLQYDRLIQKSLQLLTGMQIVSAEASQRVNMQPNGWKADKYLAGGGTLIDNCSHLINLAVSTFGKPKYLFSSWRPAENGIEFSCEIFLYYMAFIFRIHSDWLSAVGKENRITFYGDKYDVCYIEDSHSAELHTVSCEIDSGWSKKLKTQISVAKGLDRDVDEDALNLIGSLTAIDNMMQAFLDDMDVEHSSFYHQQFTASVLTSQLIDKAYRHNNQWINCEDVGSF